MQARFLAMMAAATLAMLALFAVLLHRQAQMQREVERIGRDTLDASLAQALRRQGEGEARQLAESLAEPLYHVDLAAIGTIARATLHEPGVRHLLVYDAAGNLIHDGRPDPGRGGDGQGSLAARALAARGLLVQQEGSLLDVAMPVAIGRERIGSVRVGYDLGAMHAARDHALAGLHRRLDDLARRHLLVMALLGAALLALGAAMLWMLQRFVVQPIRRLAESARAIEGGRFELPALPASARNDELGDLVRAFGRMSRSLARHDRDIRRMAYTDALTGLANRLAFRERLDAELATARDAGRPVALLFADIDDFKRINDTYGHDAGDEALLECAQRIHAEVERRCGERALLARFGGDEFVILVPAGAGADMRAHASSLAQALVGTVARPILLREREVFLSASVGLTLFPDDAGDATALIKNGDIAMYQAKVAGKNCFRFYSRAMDRAVERRVHLEHELRGAWERGELSLVYQPVFRVADRALVGAEALLRWRHPQRGAIAPSVFIDVAEQSGLIETLGPQVLGAACADAALWQARAGAPAPFVAVNLSPRQLRSGDLPAVVADCLQRSGLRPERLHLELTETAVMGDEASAGRLLSQLRASGVKVWLDDFGTGFSGLSHLRRVPVDGVKIDRSFVADILRDPDDLALTTAIIAMAHSLGMTVVAEGVEKEGQYALLRERGCNLAQGYWLGHPLPAQEFARLLG
ncbi:diguanylate cyclase/phosphodiesterase [Vulcaniibacterium tengchongense]|uniref:Diguanylate cyclase/phosphodiesterase n=1 Tax=Vulcaniibacterium tengchongense TaxID=1273429 RepID=A0A3N4VHY8_9GAMM|nr:diguanylate cyclase/phosphodiesterase [Vulcaniibacterium tengchongense]